MICPPANFFIIRVKTKEVKLSRIAELMDFLREQPLVLTTFDEVLVRRLLQKISIYDDHFTIEFKSGVSVDIGK